jgi:hypothetical protein
LTEDDKDEAFEVELARRLPLAGAVLEAFRFAFDDAHLEQLYEANRGRSYTGVLEFPRFVAMVRDCLLQHGGSGNRVCGEAERAGTLAVDRSSFYRKLANAPVGLSRALLRGCTARLGELLPPPRADLLPGCFEDLEVVVIDGKKVKNAAKRLEPTRGYSGTLLGAKALVAMDLRSGLAVAMSDSLDGEANDVPLVPDLLPQVREVIPGPILWTADRQFGDLGVPRLMAAREGDHYVLRLRKGPSFAPDPLVPTLTTRDEHGRAVLDEVGTLGKGANALRVRRVTLRRKDAAGKDDDVVLITDLPDREAFDASDLLKLYRRRWGIEQMFQQVTETFALRHLIGCTPRAVLFQFALCLLMYNLVQAVKAYVAADGHVERASVSTANLFYDVKRELLTWSYFALAAPAQAPPRAAATTTRARLRELLKGSWDPLAYPKAADKKPRPPRPQPRRLHGGHTSVQRLLEGRAKVVPQ